MKANIKIKTKFNKLLISKSVSGIQKHDTKTHNSHYEQFLENYYK